MGSVGVANKFVRQISESLYNDGRDPMDVDVYDVLVAFNVTCPAVQHAVKKLLYLGQRDARERMTDLVEVHFSIDRAMQLAKAQQIERKRRRSR